MRLNVGFLLKENVGYSREFEFDVELLELADDLDIANFRGTARLTRTPQGVYLQGRFIGEQPTECVRCLTPVNQPLKTEIKQLYEFPPAPKADFIISDSGHLDLAPIMREDMLLAMPIRPLCRPDCKGLCPNCGSDLNESACQCEKSDIHPQLAVLKKLLDKS